MKNGRTLEDITLDLLIEAVRQRWDYDLGPMPAPRWRAAWP